VKHMDVLYLMAVWIHILTVALWVGAMFFSDPQSDRFFSRLIEHKMHGIGWYALAVLWATGLFMLSYRGVSPGELFSPSFLASSWGQAMWAKIALVLTLVVFQATVGHHPAKRLGKFFVYYGYILVTFVIVAISVTIVRPIIF